MFAGQISPVKGFKLTKFFFVPRYSGVEKSVNITSIVMINMINMIMIIMGMIIMMTNMIIIIMAMIRMMMNVTFMDGGCASAIPLISATRKERRNKGRKSNDYDCDIYINYDENNYEIYIDDDDDDD